MKALEFAAFVVCVKRIRLNLIDPRVLKIERSLHVRMLDSERKQLLYEVILLNKIWKITSFPKICNEIMHHSMLPLIISCTRSWNFAWHFFQRSTIESQNIVKLLAMSQTIYTVCCEDDYFPKGKLNFLIVCFTQCSLFFEKVCFLLPICFPWVICGSYVTLWHNVGQIFVSPGLSTFARIACL